jgi:hypothetical protein
MEGYNKFLPLCRLPKSQDKITRNDEIWKKICEDLEKTDTEHLWQYYETGKVISPPGENIKG